MNILHVTPLYAPAWQFGGVVRSVSMLAEQCAAQGHAVSVITTSIGTPHEDRISPLQEERRGVRVMYYPAVRTPVGIFSNAMTNAAKNALQEVDICHITGVWQPSVLAPGRLCRRIGVPYVTSPRGALSPYSFRDGRLKKTAYYTWFERSLQRGAAAIHATSPLEAHELQALLPTQAVSIIPNICEADRWFRDPDGGLRWRQQHAIAVDAPLFLHVGRIEPKKNLPFLGDVARILPKDAPWRFVLVGPAEPRERLRVQAAFRHDPDRLLLFPGTGADGALRAIYSSASCMVMPSFHENFGNVVLEALFCGSPVLASPGVGAAHMVSDSPSVNILPLRRECWADALMTFCDAASPPTPSPSHDEIQHRFSPMAVGGMMIPFYKTAVAQYHETA
jgi:glycosyltransferase involved in cell wall biosynthesis